MHKSVCKHAEGRNLTM